MKNLTTAILLIISIVAHTQTKQNQLVINENQPIPDQGNGFYMNPILPGNYGDPSLVRVGDDYYVAYSRGNGMIIWHSKDLVNWEPVIRHRLPVGYSMVWAVDLQYFDSKFHLYMPINNYPGKTNGAFGNFVISAEKAEGPWSEPINIEFDTPEGESSIDPGFVQTPDGEKYLYVNHGFAVKLNKKGTKAVTKPKEVYKGWQYPTDWVVECMCLESPKLFYKDEYYYMVSAQGGTNGPSTAHMSVVARSKHPLGPWENSPYNPLTHTYSDDEKFWHQGHGTVFETVDGSWWTIYHGRINNYQSMGRPTLLMPVEWTEDGWPIMKPGVLAEGLIKKPEGETVAHGLILSDDFSSNEPGMQWTFDNSKAKQLKFGNGKLVITASGEKHREAMSISQYAVNKSFIVQVKITNANQENLSGLKLGHEGIATDGENVFFTEAPAWRHKHSVYPIEKNKPLWLKIVNYRKNISFFYSNDAINWKKFVDSSRNSNSYNISLFAAGKGDITFEEFTYTGLEK